MLGNIVDTMEDIEEKICDIKEQIICNEMQSQKKSAKVISPTYESEKVTLSSTIKNKKLRHDVQKEQYSSSSCLSSGEKIIISNDQDLERKAVKIFGNMRSKQRFKTYINDFVKDF